MTQGFKDQLFSGNRLSQLSSEQAASARGEFSGEIPTWFVPKSPDRYEVWAYSDEPRGHFRLFVDKEDGTLFLADYVL